MIEALANQTGLTKADVEKIFNETFDLFKSELEMKIMFQLQDLELLKLVKDLQEKVEIHKLEKLSKLQLVRV